LLSASQSCGVMSRVEEVIERLSVARRWVCDPRGKANAPAKRARLY
jgi:hypothetical protein